MNQARTTNEPEANQIKTFSVRLEAWLYDKLTAAAGDKTRNEFIKEILITHLNEPSTHQTRTTKEPDVNQARTTCEPDKNLLNEIESKNKIIEAKDQTIKNLEHEVGFLIQEHTRVTGQLDRFLMPAQEEINKKAWWQFWRS